MTHNHSHYLSSCYDGFLLVRSEVSKIRALSIYIRAKLSRLQLGSKCELSIIGNYIFLEYNVSKRLALYALQTYVETKTSPVALSYILFNNLARNICNSNY